MVFPEELSEEECPDEFQEEFSKELRKIPGGTLEGIPEGILDATYRIHEKLLGIL